MNNYNLKWLLDTAFKNLDILNKFADEKQPWQTIKDENKKEETINVLYTIAEWLRQVWLSLYSFFPEKMWEMFNKLWLENYTNILEQWKLEELRDKTEIYKIKEKREALYLRININNIWIININAVI